MAKELIIKTQKQLDAVKADFDGTLYIEGGERYSPLELRVDFEDASVIVRGEAFVRLWESSHAELRGSSHAVLRGSSHAVLRESSHAELRGSSHAELRGSSHAVLWESSHAELWESSHAVLRGSSVTSKLFGEAMVTARYAKEIVCAGYNVVSVRKSDQKSMKIVMNKDSYLKITPDFKPTFEHYAKLYPVEVKRKKAILYKAVHKDGDVYRSNYDKSFTYEIGEKKQIPCDTSKSGSCSFGLHVAHKSYARMFGANFSNLAILECEVPVDKIVVASDCDGKVRTSELKVLRELPQEEYFL